MIKFLIYLILIFITIVLIYFLYKYIKNKVDDSIQVKIDINNIPDVKWPFINLKDENKKNLNILCIRGPIEKKKDEIFFNSCLKNNIKFIGCSSFLSFPGKSKNKHYKNKDFLYKNKPYFDPSYVIGWLHCFKDPDKYIKSNIPKLLISESDFDNMNLKPTKINKKYDFIVYCPKDEVCESGWHYHNKNWPLCKKTIQILCDKFNQKGLLVGREDCHINLKNNKNLEKTKFLKYWDFIKNINQSKYIIIPSYEDASPRTITEALMLDIPILVNENILGGWKYVNKKSGKFYKEETIEDDVKIFLENLQNYKPREYFFENYGKTKSGTKLKDFIKKIYPELNDCNSVEFPVS
tara:strand:- start:2865 stop:3917 length:1053 start_codon:yes stop_codon:yes gene_type:complete